MATRVSPRNNRYRARLRRPFAAMKEPSAPLSLGGCAIWRGIARQRMPARCAEAVALDPEKLIVPFIVAKNGVWFSFT